MGASEWTYFRAFITYLWEVQLEYMVKDSAGSLGIVFDGFVVLKQGKEWH